MKKITLAIMLLSVLVTGGFGCREVSARALSANDSVTTEEIEEEDEKFATGTIDGQTYIQEFFGFKLDLAENWAFADDEKMAQIGSMVSDALIEDVKESIDSGNTYMDMYAEEDTAFHNVNATISKLGVTDAVLMKTSQKQMMNGMLSMLEVQLENIGLSNIELTVSETEFLGKTFPCILMSSAFETANGDVPFYQEQVYIQKGTYLLCLTASSYFENMNQKVLDACKTLNEEEE